MTEPKWEKPERLIPHPKLLELMKKTQQLISLETSERKPGNSELSS